MIYYLTIIRLWYGELDRLFWRDQAITINRWKQKSSQSQCLRKSFWYCIIGHNILSALCQRICSIFPQWLSLIDMNWYWATDSCSSTPAYLQTLSQYLSLLGCINLRAVTTTGKLFCGINIIMWYKSERTQKSLVKATVVRCQCWAATKHKLNQCQQCHIVSVIQYDKVLVVAYQPPRCWTMGTFLLLTITLICAKQWLVLPICAYLLLIDTAQA